MNLVGGDEHGHLLIIQYTQPALGQARPIGRARLVTSKRKKQGPMPNSGPRHQGIHWRQRGRRAAAAAPDYERSGHLRKRQAILYYCDSHEQMVDTT